MASKYLQEEAHVDVYFANTKAAVHYPYRVQSVKYASPTVSSNADKEFIDSAIGKDYTNEEVVEKAEYLDSKVVVPSDVIGNHEETIDEVLNMFQLVEKSSHEMEVVVPIQGNTTIDYSINATDMYNIVHDNGYDEYVHTYAIGGVKDAGTSKQIEVSHAVRNTLMDEKIHLFGGGMSMEWIREINKHPDLLTSIDMATPVYAVSNGKTVNWYMEQVEYNQPRGKHSSFPQAREIESIMTQYNYLISGGPYEDELDELYVECGLEPLC